jgi:DNA-binding PadR family transcriptional regulator
MQFQRRAFCHGHADMRIGSREFFIKVVRCREADMDCNIMARDVFLFEKLSDGAATFSTIEGWSKEWAARHTEGGASKGSVTSSSAMAVRLHKLRKAGFIQSKRYRRRGVKPPFVLYALTNYAVEYLAEFHRIEPSRVRTVRAYLPSQEAVTHELAVTDVVRRLKKDAIALDAEIEITGKRWLMGNMMSEIKNVLDQSNPGDVFPDLHVPFTYWKDGIEVKKGFTFLILDATAAARKTALKLEKVIRLWQGTALVLCDLDSTIKEIGDAVMARGGAQLGSRVFFGLLNKYLEFGLSRTRWRNATGKIGVIKARKQCEE